METGEKHCMIGTHAILIDSIVDEFSLSLTNLLYDIFPFSWMVSNRLMLNSIGSSMKIFPKKKWLWWMISTTFTYFMVVSMFSDNANECAPNYVHRVPDGGMFIARWIKQAFTFYEAGRWACSLWCESKYSRSRSRYHGATAGIPLIDR